MIWATDMDVQEQDLCQLCEEKTSKYTCPKCNIRYCSLRCYKGNQHEACSELFYRDNVLEELELRDKQEVKFPKGDSDLPQDFFQTFAPLFSETEKVLDRENVSTSYEFDPVALAERLSGIDLENAHATRIWNKLTDSEKDYFIHSIEKGDISLGEPWKPWWGVAFIDRGLIIDLQPNEEKDDNQLATCVPKVLEDLPVLSSLLPNKCTSPALAFNVAEVTLVYAFTMRLYDGEPKECLEEAINSILDLSQVLSHNQSYFDLSSCLHSVMLRVRTNKSYVKAAGFIDVSLKDLDILLKGRVARENSNVTVSFPLAVISHLHELFTDRKRRMKRSRKQTDETKKESTKVTLIIKKLYFFAVWIKENESLLTEVAKDVSVEQNKISEHRRELKEEQKLVEKNLPHLRPKKCPIIEELNQ